MDEVLQSKIGLKRRGTLIQDDHVLARVRGCSYINTEDAIQTHLTGDPIPNAHRVSTRSGRDAVLGFSTIFFIRSVNRPKSPGVFIVSSLGHALLGRPTAFSWM
jgi:hypothetical protein